MYVEGEFDSLELGVGMQRGSLTVCVGVQRGSLTVSNWV